MAFCNGTTATISNLASPQDFMRFLVGLSAVSGAPAYADAAKANFRYYFDHQCDAEPYALLYLEVSVRGL